VDSSFNVFEIIASELVKFYKVTLCRRQMLPSMRFFQVVCDYTRRLSTAENAWAHFNMLTAVWLLQRLFSIKNWICPINKTKM